MRLNAENLVKRFFFGADHFITFDFSPENTAAEREELFFEIMYL